MRTLRFRDPNQPTQTPEKRPKVDFSPFESKISAKTSPKDWELPDPSFISSLPSSFPTLCPATILQNHPDLSQSTRQTLLTWLKTVCKVLDFERSTYHLTVLLTDLALKNSKSAVMRSKYQLVGMACLYIAVKWQERMIPRVEEVLMTAGGTFTGEELREMERKVMREGEWRVPRGNVEEWVEWGSQMWDDFYLAIGGHQSHCYAHNSLLVHTTHLYLDRLVLNLEIYAFDIRLLAATVLYKALLETDTSNQLIQLHYWTFAEKTFSHNWSTSVLDLLRLM